MTTKGFPEPGDTAPRLGEAHVNPVTGELILRVGDYGQRDIGGIFYIERFYVPGYLPEEEKPIQPLGRRWLLNFISSITRMGTKIWLPLEAFRSASFSLSGGEWQHDEAPERYRLRETTDGFTLTDNRTPAVYTYDAAGHLISVSKKGVPPRRIVYAGETPTEVILSDDCRLELDYADDYLVHITDALGRQISYAYDKNGLLTKVTYPNFSTIVYEYDGLGRLISCIGQEGKQIFRLGYDEIGRLVHHVTDKGDIMMYNYVENNRQTIAMNKVSFDYRTYSWNRQNQIEEIIHVDGSEEHFGYDEKRRIIYRQDKTGKETHISYDEMGFIAREADSDGLIREYEYNDKGQLTAERDNLGGLRQYVLDENGWLTEKRTKLTNDAQRVEIWERDLAGRVLAYSLNGQRRQFAYEGLAPQPCLMELPAGERFHYEYDRVNRLIAIKSSVGERNFGYNALDLIAGETDPLGRHKTYEYDLSGKPVGQERAPKLFFPGNHPLRSLTDTHTKEYVDRKDVRLISDVRGQITKVLSKNGATLALFFYDIGGRLTEARTRSDPAEEFHLRRYKYDANDNVTEKRIWLAGQKETGITGKIYIRRYAYDANNRLICHEDNLGERTEYAYNELNRPVLRKIRRKGVLAEVTRYIYDAMGRLVERDKRSDYARTGKLWECDFFVLDETGRCIRAALADGSEHEESKAQEIYAECASGLPKYADISGYLTGFGIP